MSFKLFNFHRACPNPDEKKVNIMKIVTEIINSDFNYVYTCTKKISSQDIVD